ncbi:MAG TPA: HDOD domain-containing protein [Desulfotignum sp.]|nr:HDOD domain-containing protein [Desulfotignum sp.]
MKNTQAEKNAIAASFAQEILSAHVDIPAIPANSQKILDVVRQPIDKIDIASFVKLVESDPALFTKILRVANSPFYCEPEKIFSVRAAIIRIGLTETVNSVCLHVFQEMLPKFPEIQGFTYNDFWARSWACAVANRRLGHPSLEMEILPGDLFLTGMLHGLGKLLLAIYLPGEFSRCVQTAVTQQVPLFAVEQKVFGTTSALVASNVLSTWELPQHICDGVGFHQTPEQAPPESMVIAGLTQFAAALAENLQIGSSGDGRITELSDTFYGLDPISKLSDPQVQDELINEIREYINQRSESVIQMPAPARPSSDVDMRVRSKHPASDKPGKKGFLGWIKSLFR